MNRAKLALAVLALAVLTLACNLPTSLDEVTHWSDLFTIDPGSKVSEAVNNMSNVLVALSAVVAALGLAYNMATGKSLSGGLYLTGLGLLVTSGFLKFYLPLAVKLGDAAKGNITIDEVMRTYGWSLSLNPVKMAIQGLAIGQTIALPVLSALYELFMTLILVVVIIASIVGGKATAIVWSIAQLLGWVLFLFLYRLLIVMSGVVTSIPFFGEIAETTMNGFYIFAVAVLLFLCYWMLPIWASRRFGPVLQVVLTGRQEVRVDQPAEASSADGESNQISRRGTARTAKRAAGRTAEIAQTAYDLEEAGGDVNKIRRRRT